VHSFMPADQHNVPALALPFAMWRLTSSVPSGPTWWPPMARYQVLVMNCSRSGRAGHRGDAVGGFLLEPRGAGGVEPELRGERPQPAALGGSDLLVGAHDAEGVDVERVALARIAHAGHDLGQGPRALERGAHEPLGAQVARRAQDAPVLVLAQLAVA